MHRRDFLVKGSLMAFAVSIAGCTILKGENKFTGDCKTTSDILGPFFRPGAPIRSDLTYAGQLGEVVHIKGQVFAGDCQTPISNCQVELWHADAEGDYDNHSPEFKQRARLITDDKGAYAFKTIIPGRYLNGNQFRPAHFHFRLTADGYKELISQIYLQGDPYIEDDPWAGDPKAINRILPLTEAHGEQHIQFDINLLELS